MRAYRRRTPLPAPRAHPLVRELFALAHEERIALTDLADRSGVNKNTLKDWRTRTVPTIDNLEACLNVLGRELHLRPIKRRT